MGDPYQGINSDPNMGTMPGVDPNSNMEAMPGTDGGYNPMDPMMENPMGGDLYQGMNPDPNMGAMPGMDGGYNPMDPMMGNPMGGDLYQGMNPDPNMGQMPGMDGGYNPMDPMMGNPMGGDPYQGMNQDPNMGAIPGMDGQNMNPQQGYGMNQGNQDLDTAFVKTWMGTLYDNAHSKKFNWCAALLGPIYMLYRKVYTTGAILLVLEAVLLAIGSIVAKNSAIAGAAIDIVVILAIAIGLGLGFYGLYRSNVKGKLESFKKQTTDENQLLAIASKKGGVSIAGAIIGGLLLVIVVTISTVLTMGSSSPKPNTSNSTVENTSTNTIAEEPETNKYKFADSYYIEYSSDWFLDEINNVLTKGDNSLAYTMKFTSKECGFQLTTQEGRTALLDFMINQFTTQIDQTQMRIEKVNDNFVPKNDNFYNYIDFVTANSIQRYYFVVLQNEDTVFQFTLSNTTDTTINTDTNMSIIEMITKIEKDDSSPSAFGNEITTSNITADNSVASNAITNDVSNVLSNNTQTGGTTGTGTTTGTATGTGTGVADNSVNQQQTTPAQSTTTQPTQAGNAGQQTTQQQQTTQPQLSTAIQ